MSARGFGGPTRSPRFQNGGGGGGVAGANSGVFLNAGNVQLGSTAFPLLQDAQINTDTFTFEVFDFVTTGNGLLIDNFSSRATLQQVTSGFIIDGISGQSLLGNLSNTNISLNVDANNDTVRVNSYGGFRFFDINLIAGYYRIGDLTSYGNGNNISIDDNLDAITLTASVAGNTGANFNGISDRIVIYTGTPNAGGIDINNGGGQLNMSIQSNFLLTADINLGSYIFGDVGGVNNGSQLNIDDGNRIALLNVGINAPQLTLNGVADSAELLAGGAGINSSVQLSDGLSRIGTNNLFLSTDELLQQFNLVINGGSVISLDQSAGLYSYAGGITAGNKMLIDDNTNTINFTNNASTVGIKINGVTGFTGTVTPVTSITVNNGIVTNVT